MYTGILRMVCGYNSSYSPHGQVLSPQNKRRKIETVARKLGSSASHHRFSRGIPQNPPRASHRNGAYVGRSSCSGSNLEIRQGTRGQTPFQPNFLATVSYVFTLSLVPFVMSPFSPAWKSALMYSTTLKSIDVNVWCWQGAEGYWPFAAHSPRWASPPRRWS
jgi:hypothetical protein